MRIIQNGYNYADSSQNYHKFLICTHKYHPFRKTSESGWNHPPSCLGKYITLSMCGCAQNCVCFGRNSLQQIANCSKKSRSHSFASRCSLRPRLHFCRFVFGFHSKAVGDVFGDEVIVPTSGYAQLFQITLYSFPPYNLITACRRSCEPKPFRHVLQF
jgi:hypothetical protein